MTDIDAELNKTIAAFKALDAMPHLVKLLTAIATERAADKARPLNEWHEELGPVTWWKFPIEEPAWIGTPLDSDWPGYHTHFTKHPSIPQPSKVTA